MLLSKKTTRYVRVEYYQKKIKLPYKRFLQ